MRRDKLVCTHDHAHTPPRSGEAKLEMDSMRVEPAANWSQSLPAVAVELDDLKMLPERQSVHDDGRRGSVRSSVPRHPRPDVALRVASCRLILPCCVLNIVSQPLCKSSRALASRTFFRAWYTALFRPRQITVLQAAYTEQYRVLPHRGLCASSVSRTVGALRSMASKAMAHGFQSARACQACTRAQVCCRTPPAQARSSMLCALSCGCGCPASSCQNLRARSRRIDTPRMQRSSNYAHSCDCMVLTCSHAMQARLRLSSPAHARVLQRLRSAGQQRTCASSDSSEASKTGCVKADVS